MTGVLMEKIHVKRKRHIQREDEVKTYTNMIYKPRDASASRELGGGPRTDFSLTVLKGANPVTARPQTSNLQGCEEMSFCCLSCLLCGLCIAALANYCPLQLYVPKR